MDLTEATQEIARLRGEILELESNYKTKRNALTARIRSIKGQMKVKGLGKVLIMFREDRHWIDGEYWSFSVINLENLTKRMQHEKDAYFTFNLNVLKQISIDYYKQRHHVCGRSFVFTEAQRKDVVNRFGFNRELDNNQQDEQMR